MTSHEAKMRGLPERPFSPFLVREQMGPESFNCRSWTAYPPEEMTTIENGCFNAGYLAGLEAARQAVPAQSAFGNKVWDDKWLSGMMDCRATTVSNLTALVKEAQK